MKSGFARQMLRGALPAVLLLGAMSWSCAQEPPAQQPPAEQAPAQSAPALPEVFGDGAGAVSRRVDNTYGVLGASLNGPKLWLPDWTEIGVGKERDFNGLKAAFNIFDKTGPGMTNYKP